MNIQTPRQLIAAIPHLVGFHPDNSLVLVAFDDDEISSFVRIDLPTIEGFAFPEILQKVAGTLDNPHLVAIAYVEAAEFEASPKEVTTAVSAFSRYCEDRSWPVLDLLLVTDSTWRSLMCTDDTCCPRSGHQLTDAIPTTEVEFVVSGSSPFESRETLAERLAHRELGDQKQEFEKSFEDVKQQVERNLAKLEMSNIADLVDEIMLELSRTSHGDYQYIARCAVGIQNIRVRDGLLRQIYDNPAVRPCVRANLFEIVSLVPPQYVAASATVLAGCAWLDGNGALARIATDSALEADSTYSLARLLDTALSHGIPPRVWSESLAAVSYEDCLAGAA